MCRNSSGSRPLISPSNRTAIFHHMETLQKYTKEYLFDKFRAEYLNQHHQRLAIPHHSLHHIPQTIASRSQLPPPPNTSRPVLAIDTAPPHSAPNHHPALSVSREVVIGREIHSGPPVRGAHPDAMSTSTSARLSPSAPSQSSFLQLNFSSIFRPAGLILDQLIVRLAHIPLVQDQQNSEPKRFLSHVISVAVRLFSYRNRRMTNVDVATSAQAEM